MKTFNEFITEGYSLKRTHHSKEDEREWDPDNETAGIRKHSKYDIIHNKSRKKVGHLEHGHHSYWGNDDKATGKIHGKNINVSVRSGSNPQAALNHFMKKNKRAPKA